MIKIREEADPFSMDLGVLGKGTVVKVLEVGLWCVTGVCHTCNVRGRRMGVFMIRFEFLLRRL